MVSLLPKRDHKIQIYCNDSASIPLESNSIECIVVDPPYRENVMYGELSDFYYVWLKRSIGDIYPHVFKKELIEKEN